jgi:hypothetical protein
MVLEVLRHTLARIEACFDLSVRDVAAHDDGAVEREASADRILGKDLADIRHRLVEVDANSITLAGIAELLRDERSRVVVHLLDPDTVFVDLTLDVTVSRAAHTKTDWAASAVAWKTDNADIVRHILATELCTKTDLVGLLEELLLELDVAESAAGLVASSRQGIVVVGRSEFDSEEVLLSTGTTNHKSDMVRRASRSTEGLHLLDKERNECARVLDAGFSLLVEVGLVGRTTTLGDAEEMVLHTLGSLKVDLSREVALGVHLVVHIKRSVLRVAEVALGIGEVYTLSESLFVAIAGPYLLALLAVDDSRTGVLAERELALARNLGIAEESECHVLVVGTSLWVA